MFRISDLQKPIVGLSPMDGVSDSAFRFITKKYGNPDIIYTEFTHVHGLCVAGDKLLHHFVYDPIERPIIAQIYGKEPEYFYHASKMVCALGFDGLDINMGCPAKTVAMGGSGAGLIKTPDLAKEIVQACKEGVKDWVLDGKLTGLADRTEEFLLQMIDEHKTKHQGFLGEKTIGLRNLFNNDIREEISVSVKTRIGYDVPITEKWISTISEASPEWITVHGRTLKQMYTGFADWNELKIAVQSTNVPVLVNGDVKTKEDYFKVLELTGAYGALIGRATYGNPWIFSEIKENKSIPDFEEIKKVIIEHTKKFVQDKPDPKAFFQMRKHLAWYISGVENAADLRIQLMKTESLNDVIRILS